MRDAFGGLVNIVIIVVFLVIVSGYLAFNVNYTKAFRVKNKIISIYEQYEGCGQSSLTASNACDMKIQEYMSQIGYNLGKKMNINGYDCTHINGSYCVKAVKADGASDLKNDRYYYKIVTQINIDIPIINNIMGLSIFQVSGDTKIIVVP